MSKLDQAIADLVAQDHQPRQATADDGSEHMLFWNGSIVRSCLLADWPAAAQPELQADQDAQALRQKVLTVAQSAVGVAADQLTAAQLRALVMVTLWKEGALDKSGVVRPLSEWVR